MLFLELERRRADLQRHQENSARLAQSFALFETTGQGAIEFPKRVNFDLTFVERPYLTYASEIDLEALGDLLELGEGPTPPLPSVSGFVTEWDVDARGFYTGCWCAAGVYFHDITVPVDAAVHMMHHFTFTGMAMKDIPLDVRD